MSATEKDEELKLPYEDFGEKALELKETVAYESESYVVSASEHYTYKPAPVEEHDYIPDSYEPRADYYGYERKKTKKGKIYIIIAVVTLILLLIGGIAAFWWMNGFGTTDDAEETPMAVIFLKGEDDPFFGELYVCESGGEKVYVASDVISDSYQTFGDNYLVYIDKKEDLYLKRPGMVSEKIASNALGYGYGYVISKNGNAILYTTGDDGELYVYYLDGQKESIGAEVWGEIGFFDISADGKKIYYCDRDGDFWSWTAEGGNEKIASGSHSYVLKDGAYYYAIYNETAQKSIDYVKLANESDAQKIDDVNMSSVQIASGGLFALYLDDCTYDEVYYGELYLHMKNSTPIKLASNVVSYVISDDSNEIYFQDNEGVLYVREIPAIEEETHKEFSKFRDELDKKGKTKLASDVESYKVSPNGRNAAIVDVEKELYLSVDCAKAVRISTDVGEYMVADDRLCFLTGDGNLYLNSQIKKTEALADNNNLIGANVKNFAYTKQGKYISFYDVKLNSLQICIDGQTPEVFVKDANTYDLIYYKNQVAYKNMIEIDDFVGKYKNDEIGYLFEIRKNGGDFTVDWYVGDLSERQPLSVYDAIDRYTLSAFSYYNSEYSIDRLVEKNGVKWFGYQNMNYAMTRLTDEEFADEIEKKKLLEENREATEERREILRDKVLALEREVSKYYRRGIDVTSSTLLYSDHSKEHLLNGVHYDSSTNLSVRSYYVSADGNALWLQVYGMYRGDYVWILAKEQK